VTSAVTSAVPMGPAAVWVVGSQGEDEVFRAVLPHGVTPEELAGSCGWTARRLTAVTGCAGGVGGASLTLRYAVSPALAAATPPAPIPHDPDLVVGAHERPEPVQRLATYALVTSAHGVLLTAYSDRTNAVGTWGFPGGGLDGGETPVDALHREVAEETDQQIEVTAILGVRCSRWVGRAPSGRLEDFQTIRVVYRATCPQPSTPVVRDIGGTTADARWVPAVEVARMPLTTTWAAAWRDWRDWRD
jgi:8-oxo-dGTP diphosphatase